MLIRDLILTSLIFGASAVVGAESHDASQDTILFATYRIGEIKTPDSAATSTGEYIGQVTISGSNQSDFIIDSLKEIHSTALSKIHDYGVTLCKQIPDSDIKVWFTASENGKLFAGPATTSGLEVTFHCKK